MQLTEAIELDIFTVDEDRNLVKKGNEYGDIKLLYDSRCL